MPCSVLGQGQFGTSASTALESGLGPAPSGYSKGQALRPPTGVAAQDQLPAGPT